LYQRHRAEYDAAGLSLPQLRNVVARTRRNGYSETESLVNQGVGGVGVSFEITNGNYAGISVAAVTARMDKARRQWIAGLIVEQVKTLGFIPVTQDSMAA
jgi:DNA-binding IclR family transcriptional regulator